MRTLSSLRATPTDVVLRALAIATVTYHHSHEFSAPAFGLFGGMAFLLMLSGFNFGRFVLRDADPQQIRRSTLALARQIFVPSLLLMLAYFAYLRQFNLTELLFISAWFTTDKISVFPVWYCQLILQILLLFYLLFSIPRIAEAFVRRPLAGMMVMLVVGLLAMKFVPLIWNTNYLRNRLPHSQFWNFALGGVLAFLLDGTGRSSRRWIASACVMAGALLAFRPATLQFWWLVVGGHALIFLRTVRLPELVGQVVVVVSGATFTIFLLHRTWFEVARGVYRWYAGAGAVLNADAVFVAGLVLSTACWVGGTALVRAYREVTTDSLRARTPSALALSAPGIQS